MKILIFFIKTIIFVVAVFILRNILIRKKDIFSFSADRPLKTAEEKNETVGKKRIKLMSAKKVQGKQVFNFEPFLKVEHTEAQETVNAEQQHLAKEGLRLAQQENESDLNEALKISSVLKQKYPQFYFGYYITALVHLKLKKIVLAKMELESGIKVCNYKFPLYAAMGSLAYSQLDINLAIAWWIKSAIAQVGINEIKLGVPFLFLGYTARHLKLDKIAQACFTLAAQADKDDSLLSPQAEANFLSLLQEKGAETIHLSLVILYTEHISKIIY